VIKLATPLKLPPAVAGQVDDAIAGSVDLSDGIFFMTPII
jgi:hypothetical protein